MRIKRKMFAGLLVLALAPYPASAIDIRVDPSPIFVFEAAPDRNIYDLVFQNILIVNDGQESLEIGGIRIELLAEEEVIASVRVPGSRVAERAPRMAALGEQGVFTALDFQFHLSQLLQDGERISDDAILEPGEAYFHIHLYAASPALPDTARVIVESNEQDVAQLDVPVSSHDDTGRYRSPLNGRWYVFASGDVGRHHRWVISSEFALDLIQLGPDTRSYSGGGGDLEDYFAYGEPVLAAADGVVVRTINIHANDAATLRQPGESYEDYDTRSATLQSALVAEMGLEGAVGNYVLIRHENGVHSLYAHLRQDSILVAERDQVTVGQQIAEVGTSGNSTEPHLHFQLIDGPDINMARGLPVRFEGLRDDWSAMNDRHVRAGEVIEAED